jgi:hypothetical protein
MVFDIPTENIDKLMNIRKCTPNEALAFIRGCQPADCDWVWESSGFGNKEMSMREAFRAAIEKQRDL